MLQEMGVTIWAPAQVSAAPAPVNDAARSQRTAAEPPTPAPALAAAGADTAATPRAVREQRAAAPGGAPAPRPPAPQDGSPTPALVLHAAQALYPTADPAQTPAGLGAGWLVVAESLSPTEPLAGDAGRLLDNMLRAMQLHRHPRVFLAALERPQAGNATNALEIAPALNEMVATLRPAMVLVLGHVAARAALGAPSPWAACVPSCTSWRAARRSSPTTPPFCCAPRATRGLPGPICAAHWHWCTPPPSTPEARPAPWPAAHGRLQPNAIIRGVNF
jgi:hypothetical protein